RHRRLGDMVAGTIVVRDRVDETPVGFTLRHTPDAVPAAPSESPILPESEFRLLEEYLTRRDKFSPEAHQRIQQNLTRPLAPYFPTASSEVDFLEKTYDQELARRRSRVVGNQKGGVATGADRFAAARQAAWSTFGAAVENAGSRGLRRLDG